MYEMGWRKKKRAEFLSSTGRSQQIMKKPEKSRGRNITLLSRYTGIGASLVAQWLRICLPMQGTWVRALVWEDPTCRGATKPVRHNCWACALEPVSHNYCARVPTAHALQREATAVRGPRTAIKSSPRSPQLEKACAQQRKPNAAKLIN